MNMGCIRVLWNQIKDALLLSLKKFMCSGIFPKGHNSSFISLILKIPKQIKNYRPISLTNSSSRLYFKFLATRLGKHIEELVSENQYAFIKGGQAANSILLVSEVCHSIKTGRTKGLILKLDFEKFFDTVD